MSLYLKREGCVIHRYMYIHTYIQKTEANIVNGKKGADSCLLQAVKAFFHYQYSLHMSYVTDKSPNLPLVVKRKEYRDSGHAALEVKAKLVAEKEVIIRLYY